MPCTSNGPPNNPIPAAVYAGDMNMVGDEARNDGRNHVMRNPHQTNHLQPYAEFAPDTSWKANTFTGDANGHDHSTTATRHLPEDMGHNPAVATMNMGGRPQLSSNTVEAAVADAVKDHSSVVPSEEETNVALAAMQEAAAMVIMDGPHLQQEQHQHGDGNPKPPSKKRSRDSLDSSNSDHHSESSPAGGGLRKKHSHRVSWEDRLQQLRDYKAAHGDLLIPIRFKENPSLGKFVHNTREQYKLYHKKTPPGEKKKCSLTAERIRQLEELGFVWSTQRSLHQKEEWEMRLQQLKDYKQKHGGKFYSIVPVLRLMGGCRRWVD
jgi:hypothetical protein